MRKIINNPENIVEEMMEGFIAAYHHMYYRHPEVNRLISRHRIKNKVSLIIGGGSGHEPMFSGLVGAGLADAACCGNIFASPDPKNIYETGKSIDEGKGILFVYGCYAGDNLNFDMGEEFLNAKGIKTAHVRVQDDVASAPKERKEDRRGIAGDVFVVKIAGAACDAGLNLEEVTRITEKARDNTRTIGVATAPAQLPGADKPIFELGEDEIEYGMGLHGEKGVERTKCEPADVLVEKMYHQIMDDSDLQRGDKVCVLVNGLGSTTILELSIVFRKLNELLKEDGIGIYDTDLNSYCTSQEMGGFSITLMKLDDELKKYYDMPCYCPFYAKGSVELGEEVPEVEEAPKKEKKEKKEKKGEKIEPEPTKFLTLNVDAPSAFDLDRNVYLSFDEPVASIDTAAIHMEIKKDSLWEEIPFLFVSDSVLPRKYEILAEWEPDKEYQLSIDSMAFKGVYGLHTNKVKQTMKVKKLNEYGTILLNITGADSTAVVELLDGSGKV